MSDERFRSAHPPRTLRAPVSDVFATGVDWRSSIVREGEALAAAKGWADVDGLHRAILDGLQRLKARGPISTLSNGNIALRVDMARQAGLPWGCGLSAERVRRCKPDPEAYGMAARRYVVQTHALRMVAEPPGRRSLRHRREPLHRPCAAPGWLNAAW